MPDRLDALRLLAELTTEERLEVHAAAARQLFLAGPEQHAEALRHLRAAEGAIPVADAQVLLDRSGEISLSIGDHQNAYDLLLLAAELDTTSSASVQGHRLCRLAQAADGIGHVDLARQHLGRAVALGEHAGDHALVAQAAVQYALPIDWYAGDPRIIGIVGRAEALPLDDSDRLRVRAVRAMVEMRIPMVEDDGQQLAWVTRPGVAQPMGDEVLAASEGRSDDVRLLALLAWRTTHRAPTHLPRRLLVSQEALDLAQRLRNASLQVEAGLALVVDHLEAGDRTRADEVLAIADWVARKDGNPRLVWRVAVARAGLAHVDGDADRARDAQRSAREAAQPIGQPGWYGADMLLLAQELLAGPDEALAPYLDIPNSPALLNPIGRACIALFHARSGDPTTATLHLRSSLRHLDEEASYLLLLTRTADAALAADDRPTIVSLIELLTPWADRVAVDSNAWWCDGPVSYWLAALLHAVGKHRRASESLAAAHLVAERMRDVRALSRADDLRQRLDRVTPSQQILLTERERLVLQLVAEGCTNPEIARRLSFSVSTIRNELITIFARLKVKTRAQAVARAGELGLLDRNPA